MTELHHEVRGLTIAPLLAHGDPARQPSHSERIIAMYDIYFWTTPNGYKILLYAEEAALDYTIKPINISKGEQFDPEFLKISPSNRIPALVDHAPKAVAGRISVFESGAILLYLAEKTGRFIPADFRGHIEVVEWLFWQMASLGPMAGQNHHFNLYAPEKIPYAIERYVKETNRLYGVLNNRLADRRFIVGNEYSIADMASYPWVQPERQSQNIDDFPHLKRWKSEIAARPATIRAYEKGKAVNTAPTVTKEATSILFGQSAKSLDRRSAG
jgi:GSH-dependent disulfide-bond oxidoreductase